MTRDQVKRYFVKCFLSQDIYHIAQSHFQTFSIMQQTLTEDQFLDVLANIQKKV